MYDLLCIWFTMCLNSVSVFSKAKLDPQVCGPEDSFTQCDASSQFVEYFSLWAIYMDDSDHEQEPGTL